MLMDKPKAYRTVVCFVMFFSLIFFFHPVSQLRTCLLSPSHVALSQTRGHVRSRLFPPLLPSAVLALHFLSREGFRPLLPPSARIDSRYVRTVTNDVAALCGLIL